ncbi:(2Fe-2S) ferredoxin [Sphingomonas sp. DBB INV C78]|uniref:2Fe-2S iron-sulfur cluster-binding protein n=1 Tax=Sphingomonas sp. DBB INV C78 TaxID=3349434 RepID=UPI0036D2C126
MPRITYIQQDGEAVSADAFPMMTLMETALMGNVEGIIGTCGGICSCATCHVWIEPEWVDQLPAPEAEEADMIEGLAHRQPNSRLGCQVQMNEALDGLVVRVPPAE